MKTLLLLEDDDQLRRAVVRGLGKYDVEITQGSSATAGLAAMKRRDFDIVLTDFDLSEGDRHGVWLLDNIPNPERVVRCLTSSYPPSYCLLPSAVDHFFRKPLDIKEFARIVGLEKAEATE